MSDSSPTPKLTAKQRRFVEEYLKDLNGTQAAIRSGYSTNTANEQASRMLAKANIQAAIAQAMQARSSRTGIEQDAILRELAILSFSSVWNFTIGDDGTVKLAPDVPPEAIRAVASIRHTITTRKGETTRRVELKLWDKNAAIKMAGSHLGMFLERHEHEHHGSIPITTVRIPTKKGQAKEEPADADGSDSPAGTNATS